MVGSNGRDAKDQLVIMQRTAKLKLRTVIILWFMVVLNLATVVFAIFIQDFWYFAVQLVFLFGWTLAAHFYTEDYQHQEQRDAHEDL